MNQYVLNVFDGPSRVGVIGYESREDAFSFVYDASWRDTRDSYSISPHILKNGDAALSSTVRRFLENLLPEGRALDIASTTHQVSKNNIYGLIRQLGQETSGALSFFPDETTPEQRETSRREITSEELRSRIAERAQIPFAAWDGRIRMSIAGHQDKLAVYIEDGRMYLVEGALASTHILKPEPVDKRLPMLVANEHFGMSLAYRLGIAVAPVSILRVPDPVLVVERFDREPAAGRVRRLHIIDSVQALDMPVTFKYERNFGSGRDVRHIRDGVSFERLFSIADLTTRKAVTRQSLVRWALFNYVIGNSDAHGKNVSFFCHAGGLDLAPYYDLVSVVQYEALDHEMAMGYGDEFLLGEVSPYNWADLARRTGTPRSVLGREMRRMGQAAGKAALEQAGDGAYVDGEKAFVGNIAALVHKQAQKLVDMAGPMAEVSEDDL